MVPSRFPTSVPQGAITRLVDLGVDEFIIRDVLRGVLVQELQIVPCPSCGGGGCGACNQSGTLRRELRAEFV